MELQSLDVHKAAENEDGGEEESSYSPSSASSDGTAQRRFGFSRAQDDSKLPERQALLRLFMPVLGLFILFFCTVIYYKQTEATAFTFTWPKPVRHGLPTTDEPVNSLLDALKQATISAGYTTQFSRDQDASRSGGFEDAPDISGEEKLAWEKKYPCRSRKELQQRYQQRRQTKDTVATPPHLSLLLRHYENLHRTCIQKSGNLTLMFLSKTANGCRFLVAEAGNGIGNRILWMTSTLMYAILTQRVILVDHRSLIPSLMCQPFPGSSWLAPVDFPFADLHPELWTSTDEFIRSIDYSRHNSFDLPAVFAARGDDTWGPASRFYCTTEQKLYQGVTWLTLGGCLYFLPELFAVPAFRPGLESLFHNRIPLTHLLRYAMLPVDAIWARAKRVDSVYLAGADRQVGIHVRFRDGYAEYQAKNRVVNDNIIRCAVDNNILPNFTGDVDVTQGKEHLQQNKTMVFIASLYGGLYDHLGMHYPEEGTVTGEVVGLVQLTKEGDQYSGLEMDARALVEILCLSFSDTVLTSPMSTYSELAQAYGGLPPWIVSFEEGSAAGCTRGQSMDGCYQGGASTYICPHDPELDGKEVLKLVPSLKPCQDASGLQLVH